MSDRSAFTFILWDCPDEEQQRQVTRIASREFLSQDFTGEVADGEQMVFGQAYGIDEARLDAYETIGNELAEKAPGATFECWNDPKYEYSGMLFMHTPEHGRYTHPCFEDGTLAFSTDEVDRALEMQPDDRARLLGKPWLERMKVKELA